MLHLVAQAALVCAAVVGEPGTCLPENTSPALLIEGSPCIADAPADVLARWAGGSLDGRPLCWRRHKGKVYLSNGDIDSGLGILAPPRPACRVVQCTIQPPKGTPQ